MALPQHFSWELFSFPLQTNENLTLNSFDTPSHTMVSGAKYRDRVCFRALVEMVELTHLFVTVTLLPIRFCVHASHRWERFSQTSRQHGLSSVLGANIASVELTH